MELVNHSTEDEVNYFELTEFIQKYKWWVIISTVLVFIGTLVFSSLFLPKRYSASAIVRTTLPPNFDANPSWNKITFETETVSGELLFDERAVSNLLQSKEITDYALDKFTIEKVFDDFSEAGNNIQEYELEYYSNQEGSFYVLLTVLSNDPQISELFLDSWVSVILDGLNSRTNLYLDHLIRDNEIAKQKWIKSQESLQEFILQNKPDVLEVEKELAKDELKHLLNIYKNNSLLVNNISDFDEYLVDLDAESYLDFDLFLVYLSLYQQAWFPSANQAENSHLLAKVDNKYTVAQIQEKIQNIITFLYSQNAELEIKIDQLEERITEKNLKIEQYQNQVAELVRVRDRARDVFTISSAKLDVYLAILDNKSSHVYSYEAGDSSMEVAGPFPFRNAALFAALAVIASMSLALLYELLTKIGFSIPEKDTE